jgi:hypothetical protein
VHEARGFYYRRNLQREWRSGAGGLRNCRHPSAFITDTDRL